MKCRVCDQSRFQSIIDLGVQPWGNHFLTAEEVGKEPTYPLHVVYCENCHTAQLDTTVPKEVMFSNHTYLSGMTESLRRHFEQVARDVDTRFFSKKREKRALDIGSNDGTQLKEYQKLGYEVLGVESSEKTASIARAYKVPTLNRFFNLEVAKEIGKPFSTINAAGVFFHLEELHSVTDGIEFLLDEDGVFTVQFIYMKGMQENLAFDQIYHEHLLYYTLTTLQTLLKLHDLELFDAVHTPIHGGSIIAYAAHPDTYDKTERLKTLLKEEEASGCNTLLAYRRFASGIASLKEENLRFLNACKDAGKQVFGMGAPVKGNTLLNTFGIGKDLISCLVEKNPLRKGMFSPGQHLPIVLEDELLSPPDVYYVLAWNFKEEILKRNQSLIEKGVEFYFPIDPTRSPSCALL